MFKNAVNSKKQGDIGMCYAMAYYSRLGYTVSVPVTDSQDYDIIVDTGTKLNKVQVKTTKFIDKSKISKPYVVSIKTCGGNKSGNTMKTFSQNSSDLLFVMTDSGTFYEIPKANIESNTVVTLNKSMDKYKIHIL